MDPRFVEAGTPETVAERTVRPRDSILQTEVFAALVDVVSVGSLMRSGAARRTAHAADRRSGHIAGPADTDWAGLLVESAGTTERNRPEVLVQETDDEEKVRVVEDQNSRTTRTMRRDLVVGAEEDMSFAAVVAGLADIASANRLAVEAVRTCPVEPVGDGRPAVGTLPAVSGKDRTAE